MNSLGEVLTLLVVDIPPMDSERRTGHRRKIENVAAYQAAQFVLPLPERRRFVAEDLQCGSDQRFDHIGRGLIGARDGGCADHCKCRDARR